MSFPCTWNDMGEWRLRETLGPRQQDGSLHGQLWRFFQERSPGAIFLARCDSNPIYFSVILVPNAVYLSLNVKGNLERPLPHACSWSIHGTLKDKSGAQGARVMWVRRTAETLEAMDTWAPDRARPHRPPKELALLRVGWDMFGRFWVDGCHNLACVLARPLQLLKVQCWGQGCKRGEQII